MMTTFYVFGLEANSILIVANLRAIALSTFENNVKM